MAITDKENAVKCICSELPTSLEAGGVCIQGQDWGDINVARIRFPAGADATPPVSYTHLRAHETYITISDAVFCV